MVTTDLSIKVDVVTKNPKQACGNCSQCDSKVSNPYESVETVWHDPTSYDLAKHGPPYLKLSSQQKSFVRAHMALPEVREVLAQQSDYYASLPTEDEPMRPLSWLLAAMRALSFGHQTFHWQTRGPQFYGDHLLFERLYEESLPFIDEVAERAVGAGSPMMVDCQRQIVNMHKMVDLVTSHYKDVQDSAQRMVLKALFGETLFLGFLEDVIKMLKATGNLSAGTSNLLEGLADKHEQFVYLLKQRAQQATTTASYSYDRR